MWNLFFWFVVIVRYNNNNKYHATKINNRLKARPTMLHLGLKRTNAASNEKVCLLKHMITVQLGTSLLQKDYIGIYDSM